MFTDFQTLTESLPCGLVITDPNLNIRFLNAFALKRIFSLNTQASGGNLKDFRFQTTDLRVFDMEQCMQSMIEAGKRSFHKTLILKKEEGDMLVYFSVNGFSSQGENLYIFNITDISDEMDCISHSPGTFGKSDYLIRKNIIGNHPRVQEIYRMISLAADSDVNVLIQGESGTGKELVADAIHELSRRTGKPFVKVNCSALSETLLESELFGHVKGSFTGAYKDKAGKFEMSHGGTIFLDEIGEISQSLQVKLLRVIQEKTIERVGDSKSIKVDMRIIAATNKNLRTLATKGDFREDLFYRLNVFNVFMPPLRDRKTDIPALADFFMEKFNKTTSKNVKGLHRSAMKTLMDYPWPGNIRELQNAMEHAFVLVDGSIIHPEDFPAEIRTRDYVESSLHYFSETAERSSNASIPLPPKKKGLRLNISKPALKEALEMHDWNQTHTADYLGISRVALWKKMKKMGL